LKFNLLYPDTKTFGDLTILTNHFKQPKLVWICMIPTKIAVLGVKYWREWVRIRWPLVLKLFLSNWDDTQTWFHWLPVQVAPPGMLPACRKNNRLEKSVVQIITKNSHQKWLVKMAG
jgi:hypothetical protein